MPGRFTEFEPNVSFRYYLSSDAFDGIWFLCKAISLPSIDQGEVVIDYVNTDFKVKGKSRWQDITLSIYDSVGLPDSSTNNGAKETHDWLLKHHNSENGVDGWAFPNNSGYKQTMLLNVLNPQGTTVYSWKLWGAFMSAINFGSMDWAAEDAVLAEVTIKYDYATYQ
jgi:hypothetical protein